ncbi:FecR domain-containing protein [Asticcacaulis sp. DXS10W]|uniref:FecR domain-containing protein n=1 Tax=Asticcacaulis currens TaxID=2984210 RepID=A0ABT5IDV1_9CAUL|nr:FecR domain-containing protein [Asticcacaulis currens]MDC7694343.1 FecR domain-containing protein [Asticcacaulis currens]
MSQSHTPATEIEDEALAWVLRVHGDEVRDADIEALTLWQAQSDAHLAAYDRAERLWLLTSPISDVEPRPDVPNPTAENVIKFSDFTRRSQPSKAPAIKTSWVAAAAACLVLALGVPVYLTTRPVKPEIYETQRGETRWVSLKDGSRVHLNSDTRLSVRMARNERRLTLEKGELALTVVHDANKPFRVEAGQTALWDVGTEFNVLRHAGRVSVTVKSGAVSVTPATAKVMDLNTVLRPGDQAVVDEASGHIRRQTVDPAQVLAWQDGHVVYVDRPLTEVAEDLGRYFDRPLKVDKGAEKIRLTAVLPIDSEASVVSRLQAFAPIRVRVAKDALYLEPRHDDRPAR